MKDAFQITILVIGRIAEAVAEIMQIRGELCALFRVMREQFLQVGIVDCVGSEPETFLAVLKSLNDISNDAYDFLFFIGFMVSAHELEAT